MIIVTIAATSNNTISDSTTPATAPLLKDDLFLLDISDGSSVLSVSVCDGEGSRGGGVAPGVVAVVEVVMEDSIGCGGRVTPLSGRSVEKEDDNECVLVSVGLMDVAAGRVTLLVACGTAELAKCISMREREHCYIVNTVV